MPQIMKTHVGEYTQEDRLAFKIKHFCFARIEYPSDDLMSYLESAGLNCYVHHRSAMATITVYLPTKEDMAMFKLAFVESFV